MSAGGSGSCERDEGEGRELPPALAGAVGARRSREVLPVSESCSTSLGWSCWHGHHFSDSITCLGTSWSFCVCVSLCHHMFYFSYRFSLQQAVRYPRFDWSRGSAKCNSLGLINLVTFCVILGIDTISGIKQKPTNLAGYFSPLFFLLVCLFYHCMNMDKCLTTLAVFRSGKMLWLCFHCHALAALDSRQSQLFPHPLDLKNKSSCDFTVWHV